MVINLANMKCGKNTRTGNLPLGYRSYWPCLGNRPATVWFQLLWLKMLTFTRRETLSFGLFMTCIFLFDLPLQFLTGLPQLLAFHLRRVIVPVAFKAQMPPLF
eukprot:m.149926 g.149926  ORF g.149926 m.149926 type:complete len:103 (-) comp14260_c0_seq1:432-740(-)